MKQNNNNVTDFAEKIASVDGPETEIIIMCGIPCIEAILTVQQQQQQLFIVYFTYMIILVPYLRGEQSVKQAAQCWGHLMLAQCTWSY